MTWRDALRGQRAGFWSSEGGFGERRSYKSLFGIFCTREEEKEGKAEEEEEEEEKRARLSLLIRELTKAQLL